MEHAGAGPPAISSRVKRLQTPGKLWLLTLALLALPSSGCGPSREAKAAAAETFPEFTPEEATLFDDAFSPAVFSADIAAEVDEMTHLRARRSEAVFPAQVATVTEDRGSDGEHVFSLTLRPIGPALMGEDWREQISVGVGPASPSYPVLTSMGRGLVGTRVILFFRRYKGDGRVDVHWRAEPDREEVRKAVERARLLGEFE